MRQVFLVLAMVFGISDGAAAAYAPSRVYPKFAVDLPKQLLNDFIMGDLAGTSIVANDHVWIISRQPTLDDTEYFVPSKAPGGSTYCRRAPAVIESMPTPDAAKYNWPIHDHGDYKGNVWVCGNGMDMKRA